MKYPLQMIGWPAALAGFFLALAHAILAGEPSDGALTAAVVSNGAENPLKNRSEYTIFSHHRLAAYFPAPENKLERQWREADGKLANWHTLKSEKQSCTETPRGLQVAAGRITDCAVEQIVQAYYRTDKKDLHLQLDCAGGASRDLPVQEPARYPEFGLAVGDVDGAVDAQGLPHDEVVVVYPVEGRWRLLVLNQQLADVAALDLGNTATDDVYGDVAVALGDFDGNGIREIAALCHGQLTVVALDSQTASAPGLRQTDSVGVYGGTHAKPKRAVGRLAAGDFNGDGREELAIGFGSIDEGRTSGNAGSHTICTYLRLAIISPALKISLGKLQTVGPLKTFGDGAAVDLAAGLFRYEPQNGFGLHRRQLAYYHYVNYDKKPATIELTVDLFEVDQDFNLRKAGTFGYRLPFKGGESRSLAVGNFLGRPATSPVMDLAISYQTYGEKLATPHTASVLILQCGANYQLTQAAQIELGAMALSSGTPSTSDPMLAVPLVAADIKGDSYYLGTPVRAFIPQKITTRYVMYEPPKHIDYLPDDPANLDGPWSVVNVSRKDDLWVSFGQGSEKTQEVSTKDSTSYSFGFSQTYDAKEALKFGPAKWKLGVKSEQKLKFEQNYASATESIESGFKKIAINYQDTTNIDDELGYEIKAVDIWQYPCYGLKDGEKCGYYEVVIPTTSPLQHSAGLGCADWYQPRHENGNILSYPYCKQGTVFQPEDLGYFNVSGGGTAMREVLARDSRTIDGNQGTVNLNWSEQSGSEKSKTYETKLTNSADISLGATAELAVGWIGGKGASATASFSATHETSTSDNCVTKVTNEVSKGVTLSFPSTLDNDKAYHADAAIYITTDGTMKAAQAVDPLGSSLGSAWWKKNYGQRPDPALNLPCKFLWHNQAWVRNEEGTRKQMRGLIVHQVNPSSGLDQLLGTALTEGDRVVLTARVYNYSLQQSAGPFRVVFARVSYDSQTGRQGTERTEIGHVDGVRLTPLEMKPVSVDWDTAGLGGATTAEKKEYVIYVTVDPEGAVQDDLHPLTRHGREFDGGNNEGYWPWSSGLAVYGNKAAPKPANDSADEPLDLALGARALALETASGMEADDGRSVQQGRPSRLRVQIESNHAYRGIKFVRFYDNGTLFATKPLWGVEAGGTYLWTEWAPGAPGEHRLTAEVVEDRTDARPGNNTDALAVDVQPECTDTGTK